jgi:hypothetical protein
LRLLTELGFVTVVAIVFLLPLTVFHNQFATADSINPGVFALDSKPYGSTYGQWAANWWNWITSIPEENNPVGDETGEKCAIGQKGPVWFLPGTAGGKLERSCTVPAGKAIFMVILDAECSKTEFPKLNTEEEFRKCTGDLNEGATLSATVDGIKLKDLEKYRVESPMFNMTFPSNNIFGQKAGPTIAKSDGWYVILEPLSPGTHNVSFAGSVLGNPVTGTESYTTDVTYHLNVK